MSGAGAGARVEEPIVTGSVNKGVRSVVGILGISIAPNDDDDDDQFNCSWVKAW